MTPNPSKSESSLGSTKRSGILVTLQYREYRLFWIGGAFSNIGMWALIYGRLWLMHELTDIPIMLGAVTLSSLGPVIILSPFGGVIADRVNRLKLVIISRFLFASLALLTALLIALGFIQPWHLISISLATGVLLSFDIPSRQAMLPNLVPPQHLANAIAVYSMLTAGSAIIGPGMFVPLVNYYGLEGLFFLIAGVYGLTVLTLSLMKPVDRKAEPLTRSLWLGLVEGLSYVSKHRTIFRLLLIGILGGIFGMSFETLLPIFADKILAGGITPYGSLLLAVGIGGLTGSAILASTGSLRNAAAIQTVAAVLLGTSLVLFSSITMFVPALIIIAFTGLASVIFLTINNTMVQSQVDERYRGRVMSLHQFTWAASALGGFLMGALAQITTAPVALMAGGLITAIVVGSAAATLVPDWIHRFKESNHAMQQSQE